MSCSASVAAAVEENPAAALFADEAPTSRPHLFTGEPLSAKLQWYTPPRRPYSRRELLADRIVNFTGAALAWIGTPILGFASWGAGDAAGKQLGFWCHGVGLITMLTCSALYHHWAWQWAKSHELLSLDHIGISTMIMGCYIPMMQYSGCTAVLVFVVVLGFCGYAIELLKFFFPKRCASWSGGPGKWSALDVIHIIRYLVMGWSCAPVLPRLVSTLPAASCWLTLVGGLLYTIGVFVFIQGNLEFHMAIWHAKVLVASTCFYMSNLLFLVGH